jgi:hypothetical protein
VDEELVGRIVPVDELDDEQPIDRPRDAGQWSRRWADVALDGTAHDRGCVFGQDRLDGRLDPSHRALEAPVPTVAHVERVAPSAATDR